MKNVTIICLLLAGVALVAGSATAGDHGGDIHFTRPVEAVLFSHDIHVDQLGFDCDSCHDGLFEYEAGAAEQNGDFTMESLYGGGYCGACHDGETAFASDTRCATCHEGVKGYNRALGKTETAASHH
ncbi:MAG: hypothetical protein D6751_07825 [Deltaproteobacteria bacterium]|nr:MAG: hypothetical protein D6751_07825 [Deltaproteobacteria bacterium]